MIFEEFLKELRQKEIVITFSYGKIQYSGPEENITPELITKLKEHKVGLIKWAWPKESRNIIPINSEGSGTPFIFLECFNLSNLLSSYFGADQPVYASYNASWTTGEKVKHSDVLSFVGDYVDQLKNVLNDGAYILGGHSFGGTLAYEMALQLQNSGYEVPLVILFDTVSPKPFKSINRHSGLSHLLKIVYEMTVRRLWRFIKIFGYDSYFLLHDSLPELLRRNYITTKYSTLNNKYKPGKFNGDLLLFRADQISSITKDLYGWEDIVGKIHIVKLRGDHLTMFRGIENAEFIGNEIEKCLNDIRNSK